MERGKYFAFIYFVSINPFFIGLFVKRNYLIPLQKYIMICP
jgi:hypothetical protein